MQMRGGGPSPRPMPFADSHLHLPLEDLPRWRRMGLASCVVCAGPAQWEQCLQACALREGVHALPALGVHPWEAADFSPRETLPLLEELLLRRPQAAVGEIGLDGTPGRPPRERQCAWLQEQLALAHRLKRVVVLHLVRSWEALWHCLDAFPSLPLLLHGFHGGLPEARRLLRRPNAYLSLGFSLLQGNARLREAARLLPRERLLVESDAPFRGHSPEALPALVHHLALLRGEEPALLSQSLLKNHLRLFGLPFPLPYLNPSPESPSKP